MAHVEGIDMNPEGSSVLGKSMIILVIVALVAIALNFAFAHPLRFGLLGLLGFGLFCLGDAGAIPRLSLCVLEGKGYSPQESTFQRAEAVAQVAG
ncbi:MAG: hypothetical protein ACYCO5_09235 [Acidobacteriaceae bacterium]